LKFSGSPNINGVIIVIVISEKIIKVIPIISLMKKGGLNGDFSLLELIPRGLFDPVECSNVKCVIINIMIVNGRRKCSEKNRDRVAWLIENPPHNHITKLFPIIGIADIRLVMTVAPQNLIWPHGST